MTPAATAPWRIPGFATVARHKVPAHTPVESPERDGNALRNRDHEAWRQLFEREMRAIYRYAYGRLGNVDRAEDATADVFESAWRSAESFTDRGLPPRAWLFGIARHVVGTHWRRWFRQPPQISLGGFEVAASDGVVDHDSLDLARAIARLDPAHAEVITLRFLHGLSLEESAAALNVTIDAIKGRQARALIALREQVGPSA